MAHITYSESIKRLQSALPKELPSEIVSLENALGRLLFENIVATDNHPSHPTASMDGYAVRFEDLNGNIKVIGENPAGTFIHRSIGKNEAVKTFTGSYLPDGADTLINIENVTSHYGHLIIHQSVSKGFSVREVGESYKKGDVLLKKGSVITFAHIALLASLDYAMVRVVKRPKVAVIATGSELCEIGVPPKEGQIKSSNHHMLCALAKSYGCDVTNIGILEDDKESIQKTLQQALHDYDVVVTTGGVSVGDYDFVKEIAKESGETLFHGVDIKPGQWVSAVKKETTFLISLPGFPYSSFVTFLLYVLPITARFTGKKVTKRTALLSHDYEKKGSKTQFITTDHFFKEGLLYTNFSKKKEGSSAIISNLVGCSALVYFEEGDYSLKAGESVTLFVFDSL